MTRYKILIIDDDHGIITMLKDYFEFHGFLVYTAMSGAEALKTVNIIPDVILLDINMPDMDGLEVCKSIRSHISCPIIFLTARTEEMDAIIGFQSGGDDYVIKPFKINELGARVHAHLKRQNRPLHQTPARFVNQLAIDYIKREITYSNKVIPFTKKEFDIIDLLTRNTGQVFDKERIYELVWGYDSMGDNTVVVEHVRRIRQKLLEKTNKTYIDTVWGVGYKWIE